MKRKEFYSILFDETIKNIPLSNLSNSTQTPRSLPENFYDDEEGRESDFFVPFYAGGRLYHINDTDALLLFLMSGYEIKKLKILDEERFKVILDNDMDEIIYQYTKPDKFGIRLTINDKEDPLYFEIDGYSTKVLYKTRGMKRPKLLELEEINDIFVDLLTEYVKINLKMLSREDYKSMYF
jgi:hypothetical protein